MVKSRLCINDYIAEIKLLERELEDEKTPQIIGSDQIVAKISETKNRWDMSVTPSRPGQIADDTGWAVCIVSARALNSGNLVASLAIKSSVEWAITDVIDIPLPPEQSNVKRWFVPIKGQKTQPIYLKFQIIANDECSIDYEEWIPWW